MIVDGTDQFVGSDRQRATTAIATAAAQAKGNITIGLEQASSNGNSVKVKISVDGSTGPETPRPIAAGHYEDDFND